MKLHVIYYPFHDALGGATARAIQQHWAAAAAGKGKARTFWAVEHPGHHGNVALAALTPTSSVYVFGHCGSGATHLGSQGHDTNITAADVAASLQADGLPLGFAGKIKVFGCKSASDWKVSIYIKEWVWESFTQQLANEMAALGYTACSFWGYTESVRALYEDMGGTTHKGTEGGLFSNAAPASSALRQVHPTGGGLQGVVVI